MRTAKSLKILKERALKLCRKHGVAVKEVQGAYHYGTLKPIELLFHEVAHHLTLGGNPLKVPTKLNKRLGEALDRIPKVSSDSLEIDASMVTFLAGYRLDLWKDLDDIILSCGRNLQDQRYDAEYVREEFRRRFRDRATQYGDLAQHLISWFAPSLKLNDLSPEIFG